MAERERVSDGTSRSSPLRVILRFLAHHMICTRDLLHLGLFLLRITNNQLRFLTSHLRWDLTSCKLFISCLHLHLVTSVENPSLEPIFILSTIPTWPHPIATVPMAVCRRTVVSERMQIGVGLLMPNNRIYLRLC